MTRKKGRDLTTLIVICCTWDGLVVWRLEDGSTPEVGGGVCDVVVCHSFVGGVHDPIYTSDGEVRITCAADA